MSNFLVDGSTAPNPICVNACRKLQLKKAAPVALRRDAQLHIVEKGSRIEPLLRLPARGKYDAWSYGRPEMYLQVPSQRYQLFKNGSDLDHLRRTTTGL
jgi:hypothetical protein